jgi:hypothetical protein
MAGVGPPPVEQKRRRNKPPEFDELPAEGYRGDYPALAATYGVDVTVIESFTVVEVDPETGEQVPVVRERPVTRRKQVRFLHDTREWYETWATSPMATKFTAVDWNRLKRLAVLVDRLHRNWSQALFGELRLQEALFGGTPVDRLRARMRIAPPAEEPVAVARSAAAAGRRSRLSGPDLRAV